MALVSRLGELHFGSSSWLLAHGSWLMACATSTAAGRSWIIVLSTWHFGGCSIGSVDQLPHSDHAENIGAAPYLETAGRWDPRQV